MDEMNWQDRMTEALRDCGAEYAEVRLETAAATRIQFRGKELEDIGRTGSTGGCARALVKGGWGFVSFNDADDLREKVALAVSQARLVGSGASNLAAVDPVVDRVSGSAIVPAASVGTDEKVKLLEAYNGMLWGEPNIQTTMVRYADTARRVAFANTEGSFIDQDRSDLAAVFVAIARDGADVQQAFVSVGSLGDFGAITNLEPRVRDASRRACALLKARPVKGGVYTVVADPSLAGVFAHEAFGHLSESDFVYENDRVRELMVLGKRFGGDHLNILDGAAVPGLRGSFNYDDEGVTAHRTDLIRHGILVGRLHSRETAGKMGEAASGNARALNYKYPPIVRMTNTYIEPGTVPFAEMIGDIKEGVYAKQSHGGETSMEMFTFSAGEAYMIRNGRVEEMVRNVNLTGNLFQTLMDIDAVGNDLEWSQGGGCGKGEQSGLPVGDGSPHIRIRNVVIGG
jgi:TldD protein